MAGTESMREKQADRKMRRSGADRRLQTCTDAGIRHVTLVAKDMNRGTTQINADKKRCPEHEVSEKIIPIRAYPRSSAVLCLLRPSALSLPGIRCGARVIHSAHELRDAIDALSEVAQGRARWRAGKKFSAPCLKRTTRLDVQPRKLLQCANIGVIEVADNGKQRLHPLPKFDNSFARVRRTECSTRSENVWGVSGGEGRKSLAGCKNSSRGSNPHCSILEQAGAFAVCNSASRCKVI